MNFSEKKNALGCYHMIVSKAPFPIRHFIMIFVQSLAVLLHVVRDELEFMISHYRGCNCR